MTATILDQSYDANRARHHWSVYKSNHDLIDLTSSVTPQTIIDKIGINKIKLINDIKTITISRPLDNEDAKQC